MTHQQWKEMEYGNKRIKKEIRKKLLKDYKLKTNFK